MTHLRVKYAIVIPNLLHLKEEHASVLLEKEFVLFTHIVLYKGK